MKVNRKVTYDNCFLKVLEDYKHSDIVSPSGSPLELDFYIPEIKLAFEIQVKKQYLFHVQIF